MPEGSDTTTAAPLECASSGTVAKVNALKVNTVLEAGYYKLA
jgi:hypothetical protein